MRRDRISAGANEAMAIAHGFWPAAEKARPAAFYWSRPSTLVGGLDMGLLGELQHLGKVFSEEFTELIDAHLLWLDAELGEVLAQRRVVQRFLRDVVQLVHDAARSLSGRRQSVPEAEDGVRISGFRDRRHVRQERHPVGRAYRQKRELVIVQR